MSSPTQAGYITVTGRWLYYFNATHTLPVILATVQIYDLEPDGYPYPVGTPVLTDGNGYFNSGPIPNNDGPGEDGLDIIVGVFTASPVAEVINPTTNFYYYNLTTTVWLNCPDGPLNVGDLRTSYAERGAWWIFTWHFGLTRGWYYLSSTVGYNTPTVTARWPYGNWPGYWTNGTIDLPNWACWWPDIILHEYGHHIMNSLYGYIPTPPGGPPPEHYINETSNNVTAWSEGWANFFPLVVFNDPVLEDPWSSTDLEIPHWCSSGWDDGDEVEGRVAGALWDIFDSNPDGYDTFSDGFSHIWHLLSTQTDNTFREFWDAWNTSGYPKQSVLMAIFQNSIDYRGPGDVNADGLVDIFDVVTVALLVGLKKGDPNWDQRADLDYNDEIDIIDVVAVAVNFGNDYDC
jgi:hypothetical protein